MLAQWAIGIAVAVLLALLGYLVRGLLRFGELDATLKDVVKKQDQAALEVKEIRDRMLTKDQVENMILRVQMETLKGVVSQKGAST